MLVLKSWEECNLDNVINNKVDPKHKAIKKKWSENDKAMRTNLSKRNQLVNEIIKPYASSHKISMHNAALQLDQLRYNEDGRPSVTQCWNNWKKRKSTNENSNGKNYEFSLMQKIK